MIQMDINTDGTQTNVETQQTAPIDGGNLPSSQEELQSSLEKFQFNDEFVQKNFKDGKLFGRFDSMEAVLNTLHSVETKYSNVMRDIKSTENQQPAQTQAQTVDIVEVVQPAISKFVENDFNFEGLDNDIAEVAQKAGVSVAEVKLAALEMKESINKAYNIVGGKEEYSAMLGWAKENLSDAQRSAFDKSLATGLGEYAIKGLYQEFKSANPDGNQTYRRMEGDSGSGVGIRPYATFAELSKDRAYLQTPQGKNDIAARELHSKRLERTPQNVIYGR